MDNENKFWLLVWSLCAAIVITLIMSATVSSIHSTRLIAASPNPMELACALDGGRENLKQHCVVLMTRKEQP